MCSCFSSLFFARVVKIVIDASISLTLFSNVNERSGRNVEKISIYTIDPFQLFNTVY